MRKLPAAEQAKFLVTLIENTVRAIVEHADKVRIEPTNYQDTSILVTVFVAPTDMGLMLGPQGATADALRRIVWTACKKTDLRCGIDIMALP